MRGEGGRGGLGGAGEEVGLGGCRRCGDGAGTEAGGLARGGGEERVYCKKDWAGEGRVG